MTDTVKHAVITGFLSKTKDRFHEYNEEKTIEQRFQTVAEMQDIDGVEVVYPYEVSDPLQLNRLLTRYNLKPAAINVNVKAEPEFRNGGLTSVDPEIRAKAVLCLLNDIGIDQMGVTIDFGHSIYGGTSAAHSKQTRALPIKSGKNWKSWIAKT